MIILRNPGEIDLDVIKIMGVNVKENESPIGHFGTGLKYAIAVLLREKIDLCMFIGKNRYDFFSEPKIIRKIEFDVCQIKGPHDIVELPFTTEMGRNWQPWMAYREIRSNCIDENGEQLLAEAERDARRYRWLREEARTGTGEPFIARSFLSGISAWTKESADEAIDAAMNAPLPEKKHE